MAEHALYVAGGGKTRNPYFAPANVVPLMRGYVIWRIVKASKHLFGMPYQKRTGLVFPTRLAGSVTE